MPTHDVRFRRQIQRLAVAFACLASLVACEEDEAPKPLPAGINVVSGDGQYTRKGSELEDPVVVRIGLEDGTPAAGIDIRFQVIEGDGSLSRTTAATDNDGRTSVRWTVGPDTGTNRLRITVADNTSITATVTATSSEYYCVEEDPAFTRKFTPAHDLMMLTRQSSLTPAGAGIVRFHVDVSGGAFSGQSLGNYPDGAFINVVRDCAFSANGDLFISWNHIHDEVMKVATNGTLSHFATLESSAGSEIATTPNGVLVGCDERGPFYVTCRDTLFRFEDAIFTGIDRDAANNDALACDPDNGDVYFIYKQNRWLYRVPFDGTTASAKQQVAQLPIDESDGARGMVVDGNGSIFILVESTDTKSIVKVTSAGVRTTEFDLTTLWALPAQAGIQSDLAIDRGFRFLYTLDTKNNRFILYSLDAQEAFEMTPSAGANEASNSGEGERVGLDVMP